MRDPETRSIETTLFDLIGALHDATGDPREAERLLTALIEAGRIRVGSDTAVEALTLAA